LPILSLPAAVTRIDGEVPVIDEVLVSVAVTLCRPGVFRVTVNVPTPAVNVIFAGKVAALSVLVMATVPV
jgi:hypothetical protein